LCAFIAEGVHYFDVIRKLASSSPECIPIPPDLASLFIGLEALLVIGQVAGKAVMANLVIVPRMKQRQEEKHQKKRDYQTCPPFHFISPFPFDF